MDFALELIAVFLAVTLAFWAENLRETRSERAHERSYLAGILRDLRRDVAALDVALENWGRQRAGLISTLEYFEGKKIEVDAFLESYFTAQYWDEFRPSRATYQEVVSAGHLRLLRDRAIRQALLELQITYESLRLNEQHVYTDYKRYMVDPMYRTLRIRYPGPWSDDPRYEQQIRGMLGDFVLENGLRGIYIQYDEWLGPAIERARTEAAALVRLIEERVPGLGG